MSTSEHVKSWYAASTPEFAELPALQGAQQADVAILGAGLTGLSTAIELAQAGYKVAILEAKRIAWGASGRSGGQAIFGFGCDQSKITAELGLTASKALFDWSIEGLDLIGQRCREFGIDCDWQSGHAHVPIKARHCTELKAWQHDLAENFNYPLDWWSQEQLHAVMPNARYRGALFDARSGHLHPLKYTLGLAKAAQALGVRIYENSKVTQLQRSARPQFRTAHGTLDCDFAVLAGNALVHGIAPELDRKIMPVGTYIGATEPLGQACAQALIANNMAVADVNWALDYFRLSRDYRLLFGGRASYSTLPPPDLAGTLRRRMQRVFPHLGDVRMDSVWGGYVDISQTRAPHWGRLGSNVYFAQGFSGHGIAATGLAGRIMAEAIRGQAGRLDAFAGLKHRDFPGGRALRTPLLVAAMAWFKLRDALF